MLNNIFQAFIETLFIIIVPGLVTLILGLIISIILAANYFNQKNSIVMKLISSLIFKIEKAYKYLPFIAIILILLPIAKYFAEPQNLYFAILPLTLFVLPQFVASSFIAIITTPKELQEIYSFYNNNKITLILKVYLPECINKIIKNYFHVLTLLVGYSAIAGFLGAPGLGKILYFNGIVNFDIVYLLLATISLAFILKVFNLSEKALSR